MCKLGLRTLMGLAAFSLVALPAMSCMFTKPLSKDMEGAAEVVFYAVPSSYEIITCPSQGKGIEPFQFARVGFKTSKTIRGEDKKEWLVIWINGNFGLPKKLSDFTAIYGSDVEVGLARHGTKNLNLSEGYSKFPEIYNRFGKLPCVIQEPCSEPYIKKRAGQPAK